MSLSLLSDLSHLSPSLLCTASTHAQRHMSARGRTHHHHHYRPALSLPLVLRTQKTERNSGGFLYFSGRNRIGCRHPSPATSGGFSGHLRPFHDERKVKLLLRKFVILIRAILLLRNI
ncbi:uncharacterized protein LOC126602265 isoform X2 [Malus sylvestris]|uniref:uncharacterized protein LOC126602265 isoform X2 n=1 Tax=Malus sylvestris TaxID=3752 RepID=UPI0007ED31FA|nr:uncharacterized protein LOC126602265 isoform X2 [Malus sylvestris]